MNSKGPVKSNVRSVDPMEELMVNPIKFLKQIDFEQIFKPVQSDEPKGSGVLAELIKKVDSGELDNEIGKLINSYSLDLAEIFESSDSFITTNKAMGKTYTTSVARLVINLRGWCAMLESHKYRKINFDAPVPVWTRKDKNIMRKEMYDISFELREQKISDKRKELEETNKKDCDPMLVNEMYVMFLQDIHLLHLMPWKDIVFPLSVDDVYNWDRVSGAIQGRHSPAECQEFWHTKLHPSNRNRTWSKAESRALADVAEEYHLNNWDQIARKLNTNRSGSQCFLHYRRYLYQDMMLRMHHITSQHDPIESIQS